MNVAKVFIFAPADPTGETHKTLEDQGCELILGKASWDTPQGNSEAEMVRMAQGCAALMGTSIRNAPINRTVMESSDSLRIVAKYTIGTDDVDVEAATELGILVTHGPTESNWGGVAEGTITAMLTMLKKARERDRHLKEGGDWRAPGLQGTYLGARADGYRGITLGLIGLGRIGSRVATLMRPWKMRILAADPYVPNDKFTEHGVERVDLDTLLRESDVVSLHVVLTRETRHLIGPRQLALMKPGAILINTSRGPCVQEPALIEAILRGQIAGAALDVFEEEPLSRDSPLRNLGDKVLLSPHMVSSNVGSGLGPGIRWATESVLHALRGEVPDNVYNREVIPRWQSRFGGTSVWDGKTR
jgi:phosphoglycerate dehydrogenase-like enzyme